MKEQLPINTAFGKAPPEPVLTEAELEQRRQAREMPCSGLTDDTWPRPRSKFTILDCIVESSTRFYGAKRRDLLCKELFGGRSEPELDEVELERLAQERRARATWVIERETAVKGIFSTRCLKVVRKDSPYVTCSECLAIKHDASLLHALNHPYAESDKQKPTRKDYLAEDLYQAARRDYPALDVAATTLEKASKLGDQEFWRVFAARAIGGGFDHLEVFKGLLKAVSIRAERIAVGKGTTGMMFQQYFDDFVMTLAALIDKPSGCTTIYRESGWSKLAQHSSSSK